jgi:flagellar motor protein MotB
VARHRKHEEHENHERWLVSYADFITLLFAFFVVMYAVSSVNEGKYRVLSDSMMAAFRGSPKTTEPIQIGYKVVRAKTDESVAGLSPSQAMKLPAQRDDDQTGLVERFGLMGLEDGKQAEAAAAAPVADRGPHRQSPDRHPPVSLQLGTVRRAGRAHRAPARKPRCRSGAHEHGRTRRTPASGR